MAQKRINLELSLRPGLPNYSSFQVTYGEQWLVEENEIEQKREELFQTCLDELDKKIDRTLEELGYPVIEKKKLKDLK